ncbi:MAG: DUF3817 domain-containing protein [Rhodoluna sp.]
MASLKSALSFYRITSITTGVFLLLVVFEMVLKYAFNLLIWSGGEAGLLGLVPAPADETVAVPGVDISRLLLQVHGVLYVVYLLADFQLWRLGKLKFTDFIIIASGGVIPLTSFFIERSYHKKLELQLKAGA